jgi:hypothetical protein
MLNRGCSSSNMQEIFYHPFEDCAMTYLCLTEYFRNSIVQKLLNVCPFSFIYGFAAGIVVKEKTSPFLNLSFTTTSLIIYRVCDIRIPHQAAARSRCCRRAAELSMSWSEWPMAHSGSLLRAVQHTSPKQ